MNSPLKITHQAYRRYAERRRTRPAQEDSLVEVQETIVQYAGTNSLLRLRVGLVRSVQWVSVVVGQSLLTAHLQLLSLVPRWWVELLESCSLYGDPQWMVVLADPVFLRG